jgi:hypothetical protein
MSNEARRQPANLMLMCYPHHQVTNDVAKYTVAKLRKMKRDHEGRFSDPARAILEQLTDWTAVQEPSLVKDLKRMDQVMGWNHGPLELQESVDELNAFIAKLRNVPIELRRFAGAVARRALRMEGHRVTQDSMFGVNVLVGDFKAAYGLSASKVGQLANQLDGYGIGCIDDIDTDMGPQPAVRLHHLRSGWKIWPDIVSFCDRANEPLEAFTEELDFSRLDADQDADANVPAS